MKTQIKNNNDNKFPAGLLRRGALKLLLASLAVLGSLGSPSQVRAQSVDPGTGILPPEPAEVVLRAGYRPAPPLKPTRITNLKPTFTVKNGTWVTLEARLEYLDNKNKWQPMGYKPVPLQFFVGNRWNGSANVDRNGWARVTFQIRDPYRIPPVGKLVSWRVLFAGDTELRRSSNASKFRVMP